MSILGKVKHEWYIAYKLNDCRIIFDIWSTSIGFPIGNSIRRNLKDFRIMWVALISPITITFLLLKVSGISLLEKKYEGNIEFQEYKKRTSALFPLPPKV